MTLRTSIVQARTFARVTDSAAKKNAFLDYARTVRRLVEPAEPRTLIWCPCKAPAYFQALMRSVPPKSPAHSAVKKLLAKL